MSPAPNNGGLQRDLMGGAHDALYRAMSFIAHRGGPAIAGPADDQANLAASRGAMLAWLQGQANADIARDYERYRRHWSPVFKD